jgi:hypothetical protein
MLAFKKLGITPIVMSAGELESGNAGEPAKLLRQRYREASDSIKKVSGRGVQGRDYSAQDSAQQGGGVAADVTGSLGTCKDE